MNLASLERFIGRDWLEKRVEAKLVSTKRGAEDLHPIRLMWSQCRQLVTNRIRLPDLTPYSAVADFLDLTAVLKWTNKLPGFNEQILPRLMKVSTYKPALYEARIARHLRLAGLDVRFADACGTGGGTDLNVFTGGKNLKVEAKYKDRINMLDFNIVRSDFLRSLIITSLLKLDIGIDVTCLLLGVSSEASFQAASEAIGVAVHQGFRGTSYIGDPGMWLTVEERPQTPTTQTLDELNLSMGHRGFSYRSVLNSDGQPSILVTSTFSIAALPVHTVTSVLRNIRDASRQIGKNSMGIIYIDVDPLNDSYDYVDSCLTLISKAVAARAWGGNMNSRVKCLVFSYGTVSKLFTEGVYKYYAHTSLYRGEVQPGIQDSPDGSSDSVRSVLVSLRESDALSTAWLV